MKTVVFASVAALAMAMPVCADATVLLTSINGPSGTYDLSYTATSASTTVSFGGYDVPSFSSITGVQFNDSMSTNLFGPSFVYTPAPCGALASQFAADAFSYGGVCSGSYDRFSQAVATTVGANYTVHFVFNASGSSDYGIQVTAGAVPEPASWALMIAGFVLTGLSQRRRKVVAA